MNFQQSKYIYQLMNILLILDFLDTHNIRANFINDDKLFWLKKGIWINVSISPKQIPKWSPIENFQQIADIF